MSETLYDEYHELIRQLSEYRIKFYGRYNYPPEEVHVSREEYNILLAGSESFMIYNCDPNNSRPKVMGMEIYISIHKTFEDENFAS